MQGVTLAKLAVFPHLKTVSIVTPILHGVVVALLTFRTSQCYLYSHTKHLPYV